MNTSLRAALGTAAGMAVLAFSGCGSLIPDRTTSAYPAVNPDSKFLVAAVKTRVPVLTGTFLRSDSVQQQPKEVVLDVPATTKADYETLGKGLRVGIHQCTVMFVVDESGRPTQVQWTASNSDVYTHIVLGAVQHMAFEPAKVNGKPVACAMQMNFQTEVDGWPMYYYNNISWPSEGGPGNGYYRM